MADFDSLDQPPGGSKTRCERRGPNTGVRERGFLSRVRAANAGPVIMTEEVELLERLLGAEILALFNRDRR